MTRRSKAIALLVAATLFLEMTISPSVWMVYATEEPDASEPAPKHFLSEEKVVEKGTNYTVFDNEDGTETLEIFTSNIRTEEANGELRDVDNSLMRITEGETEAYKNVNGFADVVLPETLSADTPVRIEDGSNNIRMIPAFGEIRAQAETDTSDSSADSESDGDDELDGEGSDDVEPVEEDETEEDLSEDNDIIEVEGEEELPAEELITEDTEDLYSKTEEKETGIRYSTPDPSVFIEYSPTDSGVKENIVLTDKPLSNVFSFIVKAKGQHLEKQQKGIVFKDNNTNKVKGAFQEPFMTDSSNSDNDGYSEDLEYSINTIDADKGIYRVDITVSNEYLSDEDRVYPVIIDPTYTANTSSHVQDAYVLSKHSGTNYYSNGVTQMVIGYGSSDGKCRTYIKFPNLQSKISGTYVQSATFTVKERNNTKPFATMAIYRVPKNWTPSKVTWNNQPSYTGSAVASKTLTGKATHTLNVRSLVQGWASGSYGNYGILLKATVEKSSTKNFCSLYGARFSTAASRPKLTVTYVSPSPSKPATPTVSLSSRYIQPGTANISVSWSGATSNILDAVQLMLTGGSYTNVGTTASGTYSLNTSTLTEGAYTVSVRGVDKLGKTGNAGTAALIVDGTAPESPRSVSVETSRMDNNENAEKVKVSVSITQGTDLPSANAAGISANRVSLFDAISGQLLETQSVNGNTAEFNNVTPDHTKIYVTVKSIDNAGNESQEYRTADIDVKNVLLPNFDAVGSFISDLETNPWRSNLKKYTTVSWNADYDGNLGKITAEIVNEDDTSVSSDYDEKEILKDQGSPKKHNNFRLDKVFDYSGLADGRYKAVFRFYPEADDPEEEPVSRKKELPLYIDNTAPVLEAIAQEDPEAEPKYIMPDTDDPLTGMVQLSYAASDDGGALGPCSIVLTGAGIHKTLTESQSVYNLNTTEYEDGIYTISVTQEDMAGNKVTAERQYTISNPPPTPKIVLESSFGGSDDPIGLTYSYPSGDMSTAKVASLKAALIEKGREPEETDYVTLDVQDPTQSGEATFQVLGANDGEYELCVKAVDINGAYGKVRRIKYIVDSDDPQVRIDSPSDDADSLGWIKVSGKIEDDHLKGYRVSIANGDTSLNEAFEDVYDFDNPKDLHSIEGLLGVVDISSDTDYPTGSVITIRVDAEDKCGNRSTVYRTITKRAYIEHAADFEIVKDQNGEVTAKDPEALFNLQENGQDYTANDLHWYVDGKEKTADTDGRLDFSDISEYPDDSIHSIAAVDKKTNGDICFSSDSMEYSLHTAQNIEGTTDEYIYEQTIHSDEDIVSARVDVSETIPDGAEITYYIKTADGEYTEVGEGEETLLSDIIAPQVSPDPIDPEEPESQTGIGTDIYIKAVLSRGTASTFPKINNLNVTARVLKADVLRIGLMDKYNPVSVTEIPEINYKVKVSWQLPEGTSMDGLTFEIYRSTDAEFSDSNTVLLQEGIEDTCYLDNYNIIDRENNANNHEGSTSLRSVISNADFYYKVVAVKSFGTEIRKSSGKEGSGVVLPAMDEYTKRLGDKDYLGYSEHDIGGGSAKVEQSMGNFTYSETDAYVKGKALDIAMVRTYNSMSTGMTALGYSWDFSFNPILLEMYDSYGDNTGILFKDGTGTIYTFPSIRNDAGIQEIKRDGTDDTEKIETHYRSPFGAYIHLIKTEFLDIDDADQDEDREEVIDLKYTIKTLSGDTYTFNRNSQIEKYLDSNGNEIDYSYDNDGRLVEVRNPAGNTSSISFEYYDEPGENNARELIHYAILPHGRIVEYEYTDDKMLSSSKLYSSTESNFTTSNIEGAQPAIQSTFTYTNPSLSDKIPLMTSLTDPNGNVSEVTLRTAPDARGRCEKITYPNGDKTEYTYHRAGTDEQLYDETIETVSLMGTGLIPTLHEIGSATYRYNSDGNITYIQDIEGSESEYEYMLGLEISTETDSDVYEITDSGIIEHSVTQIRNETVYDSIPDSNTIASKIGSTKGNVKKEKDSSGNVTKYEYNAPGEANEENPTSIKTDAADGVDMNESFEYDENGNLTEVIDEDTGESVAFTYNDDGEVVTEVFHGTDGSITDTTTYTYDAAGNLTKETSSNGSSPTSEDKYQYDAYGRVIADKDARGFLTTHTYDALDREVLTTYYLKATAEGSFEGSGETLTESKAYDDNGNLLSETDREGRVISYHYDNMDRVTDKTITKGDYSKTWEYEYSVRNETLEFQNGSETVHNASVTEIRNPDNVVTSVIVKDKAGNTVRTVQNGISTNMHYSSDGEVTEIYTIGTSSGQNGQSLGLTVLANYDKYGNNTSNIVDPGWNGTNYYVSDDTQVYRYTYDSLGNVLKKTDPENHQMVYKYDSNSRTTSVEASYTDGTEISKATSHVRYEIPTSSGNTVTAVTNAMGQTEETETDPSGNVTRITDKGLGTASDYIEVTYTYDALGNLVSEQNANGTKTYTYDSMNNMTECVSTTGEGNNAVEETSVYTYDRFGAVTSREDYRGTVQYGEAQFRYDNLKRLSKYYYGEPLANEEEPDWTEYSYDIEDNLTEIIYPDFMNISRVTYAYDSYNRVTSVNMRTDGAAADSQVREYEYRSDNRVLAVNDYSSSNHYIRKSFDYDELGRCTAIYADDSVGNRRIESFNYTYDKCNNITSEEMMHSPDTEGSSGGSGEGGDGDGGGDPDPDPDPDGHMAADGSYHVRRDYTYNELSELTGVNEYSIDGEGNSATETLIHTTEYTYDKIGSRTSETKDGETYNYTYDSYGFNQLTEVTKEGDSTGSETKTYSYDAAGNLIQVSDNAAGTVTEYEYNVSGMLVSAEVINSSTGEKLITENSYDGAGVRVAKAVTAKDSDDQVISTYNIYYFVSGDNLLCTYTEDNNQRTITSENIFGIDGRIIITLRGADKYVYATDLRGSTTSILNDDGDSECVYYYDVYGEPEVFKNGSLYNEILFTGAVYDKSTGLLYLSSRFYDAESGRFTSMDSYRGEINDPLSLNYYGYCNGNPATFTDESGHLPTVIIGAVIGGSVNALWEIGTQLSKQLKTGEQLDLKKINYKVVGVAFVAGAISGAIAGTGATIITTTISDGVIGFAEDVARQRIEGGAINWQNAFVAGGLSSISSAGAGILSKARAPKYSIKDDGKIIRGHIRSRKNRISRFIKNRKHDVKIRKTRLGNKTKKPIKKTIKKVIAKANQAFRFNKTERKAIKRAVARSSKYLTKQVTYSNTIKKLLKTVKKKKTV